MSKHRTVYPEQQIQQINELNDDFAKLQHLPLSLLIQRPSPKQWAILEIIEHLNATHELYRPRLAQVIQQAQPLESPNPPFRIRPLVHFFIKGQAPKNDQRRWRLSTFKALEPQLDLPKGDEAMAESVFQRFFDHQAALLETCRQSRLLDHQPHRVISAIGPMLKFYLPEAISFLLAHEERHLLQAREYLAILQSLATS